MTKERRFKSQLTLALVGSAVHKAADKGPQPKQATQPAEDHAHQDDCQDYYYYDMQDDDEHALAAGMSCAPYPFAPTSYYTLGLTPAGSAPFYRSKWPPEK